MVLDGLQYNYPKKRKEIQNSYDSFYSSGDVTGYVTYSPDGDIIPLESGMAPINIDGNIVVPENLLITTIQPNQLSEYTYIFKTKISDISDEAVNIMTTSIFGSEYFLSLTVSGTEIILNKFDHLYLRSITITDTFNDDDIFVFFIRIDENNKLVKIDVTDETGTLIGSGSLNYLYDQVNNGIINFGTSTYSREQELYYFYTIFEFLDDSEISDIISNISDLDLLSTELENELSNNYGSGIKTKTLVIDSGESGDFDILTGIPSNMQVYIHDVQIRAKDLSGGFPFDPTLTIKNSDSSKSIIFQGIESGGSLYVPSSGYWNIHTSGMGLSGNIGPYGFDENGFGLGKSLIGNLTSTLMNDLYITIYYTIEAEKL